MGGGLVVLQGLKINRARTRDEITRGLNLEWGQFPDNVPVSVGPRCEQRMKA